MKLFKITILLFFIFLFIACGSRSRRGGESISLEESCEDGNITVWGEAPIFTSLSASRVKAKEDACRRAVEKCIGEEVASATGVSDGQSILNEIFTTARGICKNDRLLKIEKYNLDTIKMLRAFYRFKVKRSDIRNKIDLSQKLIGNPKIIVLIREEYNLPKKKVINFYSRDSLVGKLLRNYLKNKGYTLIDPNKIKAYIKNENYLVSKPQEISTSLQDVAMKVGADVLIIGKVEAFPQNLSSFRGTGLKSFRATGNVSILSLWGAGKILGEYTDSQPGAQVTPLSAARSAVSTFVKGRDRRNVGGMLVYTDETLREEWATITRNNRIQITVLGMKPEILGIFRDNLEEATAVKSIDEIEVSNKKAIWEVTYPGRAFALGDTIRYYGKNPKIFPVLSREKCASIKVPLVKRGSIRLKYQTSC